MAETLFPTEHDEEVLRALIALAEKEADPVSSGGAGPLPAFHDLLEQFAKFATGDDRLWDNPRELLARARLAWAAGLVRKPGMPIVSLDTEESLSTSNTPGIDIATIAKNRMVLRIVTDDKPFLVDSINGAITEAGKAIHFFVNAVVATARDEAGRHKADGTPGRESMIYAEIDAAIDDADRESLIRELTEVLNDIEAATNDWQAMRQRLDEAIVRLRYLKLDRVSSEELQEIIAFLTWLLEDRFAFLGVRRYNISETDAGFRFEHDPKHDLGTLKNSNRRILRNTFSDMGDLSPAVEAFLRSDEPILVAKANSKSLIHRRTYQDYIGVKIYDPDGKVIGEDRFVGLFTSDAYNRPASDIPLLREKVRQVIARAPFFAGGHNEKALLNILETYPRDELFQADINTIRESAIQILRLYKRPRVKLIMRRDRFDRFISAFVFVPRDQFNSDRREAIGDYLAKTFNGRVSAFYPFFGDAALVRVHYIIGLDPGAPQGPGMVEMTRQIRAICRDWGDALLQSLRASHESSLPPSLFSKYQHAFNAGYRDDNIPEHALNDIVVLERMGSDPFAIRAYRLDQDRAHTLSLKLYRRGGPIRLSDLIPTLENFSLHVLTENSHQVRPKGVRDDLWIHDIKTENKGSDAIAFDAIKTEFERALNAIFLGQTEDDAFNALVLRAGLSWEEAWIFRAGAKYHLQTGITLSQDYIAEALARNADITRALMDYFRDRFDPTRAADAKTLKDLQKTIRARFDAVESLDDDRILRRYLNFFAAIVRTNYYQKATDGTKRPCLAFKIDSEKITEMPAPKPYREIFVSGPGVDGIHLRFGPVSRGGLRWSDRKEDFRTEVLGLVKAQRVKNAVIVPNGSKGGFFPKQIPQTTDRNVIYEAGRDAYKLFINSLLDVTDNIIDGEVTPPPDTVIHDGADPYLVVAADKGTAQFSDTANEIALGRGFWLGDAFASGGSAGYDHKKMGITARGAWEAVKRHFRERGKDIQIEPFTVAGVGDMSGDVFGNGMLLSEQIRLVAAFDHRDIFIDPDPDPGVSYAERKRLFDLPRSSWQDYNPALISKGGGVFSRQAKSIPLSEEIRQALGVTEKKMTPAELLSAILRAPVELFWLGGIGTYFKAASETNWQVGDRGNDSIRINADEMRINVIGEGANLGLTQKARIAFARQGGHVNTDAIDNSAGVDSSDHEVNIKILLDGAMATGALEPERRNDLLAEMTDEVAALVLRHNYDQTRALSQAEDTAAFDLDAQARFINFLESEGRLDRQVEELPSKDAIVSMLAMGQGLTRPELSVLMAYAKLWLFDALVDSTVPDDPVFVRELYAYFPEAVRGFTQALENHRLRREIIATRMANEIVDTCGISFVHEALEVTGASIAEIASAYEAARQIYGLTDYAAQVNALDNKIDAQTQLNLYEEAALLLREQTYRLVTDISALAMIEKSGIQSLIDHYQDPIRDIRTAYKAIAPADAAEAVEARMEAWRSKRTPEPVAREAALFPALERALDIVDISRESGETPDRAGAMFFAIGRRLRLDRVRESVRKHPAKDNYDKRATRRLMEEITRQQKLLTLTMMRCIDCAPLPANAVISIDETRAVVDSWAAQFGNPLERYDRLAGEIDLTGRPLTVSQLALLNRQLIEVNERVHP